MKRWSLVAVCLGLCAARGFADYQKGSQSVTLHIGPSGYSDNVDLNNGDVRLRDCSAAGGLQYLYYIHGGGPTLAIGPDILWIDSAEEENKTRLLGDGMTKADQHIAITQVVMKLAYPSGHFRPYILGGLGASRSHLKTHVTPGSGITWADTGTSEVRETFDSVRYGFAGTFAAGFDYFIGEHLFLGTELRVSMLSRHVHEPTSFARSQGIEAVRDPGSVSSVLLKIGYKFGAK